MAFWKQILAAMLLAATGAKGATNFYAQAAVTETNVYLGQVFNLDVVVSAPKKAAAPDLPELPEFNMTLVQDGEAASEPDTWLYRYSLRATRAGDLKFPPLQFGNSTTAPIPIKAMKPDQSDRMTLEQKLSKQSVYEGEPVLLTTIWDTTYRFSAIKAVDFNFSALTDPRLEIIDPYEPGMDTNDQATGLPVQGTRVLARRKSYTDNNLQHQTLSFDKILIPRITGQLTIPPSTLLCATENENPNSRSARGSAFQYPAYFDNTFFDQNLTDGNWKRIYTESPPLSLDVKPLPSAGKPDLFSGIVGNYTMQVDAAPKSVRVGDPVTLTITIATPDDFMETISFPPLRDQPGLASRFDIPSERSLPERKDNAKIYTQTIRPRSTDVDSIPPLQLSFFSTASNAYTTLQSEAIPLQVAAAEKIDAYGEEGILQNRLRRAEGGIRQNYEHPDMLESHRLPLFGWADIRVVLAIFLIPPLVVGGLSLASLFSERKYHIQRTAKAARAYRAYRRNAAHIIHSHTMKNEIYSDLDKVLRAYFGDRLHLKPGALSFRDVETRLLDAGCRPPCVEDMKALFTRCETYRFTRDFDEPADAHAIVHAATRIVKSLERSLR